MRILNSNVDLRYQHLKEIPNSIAMDSCNGFYDVSNNNLTSLKNSPVSVVGEFCCHRNKLTSLIGGPQFVSDIYRCQDNRLVSLNGIAKFTKDRPELTCGYNKITSLTGNGFESVRFGVFNVESNSLVSLNGSPKETTLYNCSNNPIVSFEGAPLNVTRNFIAENLPKLKNLSGLPREVSGIVFLSMADMLRVFPNLTKYDKDIMIDEIKRKCRVWGDIYIQ
jgi:hypothetical protein